MFNAIILRFRVAKVQAELQAQINNQALVSHLCQLPVSVELIDFLYRNAYYRKRKDAAFLIVCALMVQIINEISSDIEDRKASYLILKERYERLKCNRHYCIENFLVVGDCEEAIILWERSG